MKLVKLDLGYGYTKGACEKQSIKFQSVIGEGKELFEGQFKEGDLIYDNKYFIGDLAVRQSDVCYFSKRENKAEAVTTEILAKAALGVLNPHSDSLLVTGLPVDFYFQQKEHFSNFLLKLNEASTYEINLFDQSIVAKPFIHQFKIVPQPLGSAMDYLLDDKGNIAVPEAKQRILIVDIGFYTLDMLILNAMEIDKKSYSSNELGVSVAYRYLQKLIRNSFKQSPQLYELDKIVLSGVYEGKDIGPLIRKAFDILSTQINEEIESLNMNFQKIILTGGAANFLNVLLPNTITLPNPQFGNVRGYGKIGRRVWKESSLD
ncbi:hypothetical protein CN692_13245 [Bacillus sp. AFS002410]|uniref:ParM/StbA family protein n=1 Tax=Bacillus sp. AFS002410 TaxID=2033481 RepID=UPI000BF1B26D|nr:ParM/StbA family protein [Bacillus sp. AFS002410]PEJ57373.1 hypothetical protein CN692_13245 [Bacillus sp. AFS002410]